MTTFLLNLPKNKERLASMTEQLSKFGIEFESFAIVGADLTKTELKRKYSSIRAYIAQGRALSIAEIGCTLSHLECYRRIVQRGLPWALILEDDVIFKDEFPTTLGSVEKFLDPKKPQVVLFSGHDATKHDRESLKGIYPIKGAMCNDVYCVTNAAAKKLLEVNDPIIAVCDRYDRWVKRGQIDLYRVFPISADQDQVRFKSDLGVFRKKPVHIIFQPFRKVLRLIEKIIDYCLYLATGR